MKISTRLLLFAFTSLLSLSFSPKIFADVITSSSVVAAANIQQGSTTQIISITKMDVSVTAVTVNSLQVTLSGTHDNDDINNVGIWFNATTPSLSSAVNLSNQSGNFAGPHTYTFNISSAVAAGTTGYYIITINVSNTATHNHTIKVNGATDPVQFGFTSPQTYTNNQTDAAGLQTIQAADVTVSSATIPIATLPQGSTTQIVYAAKLDVSTQGVSVNTVQVTLSGTHDNNDLTNVGVWFNAAAPSLTGAINLSNQSASFAAPHTYTFNISRAMAAGSSGYFIITINISSTATHNNTIKVNGATNPVILGFPTAPNYTNTQTDAAGLQTIQAADVTVSSVAVPVATLQQSASTQPVYIMKADVSTQPVTVNSMQVTLSGTHDNNDLTNVGLWFNTTPSLSGATNISNQSGAFAAPHTYTFNISRAMAAGTTGYFIITVNVSNTATHNNTIKVDGATNPVVAGFTTAPNYTNTQTDAAGLQTIQAADVTVSSIAVPAATLPQSASTQPVYMMKADVSTQPVTVNSVQVTLSGTHDNNDLSNVGLWFNATSASLSGATNLSNQSGSFAAPHTYTFNISRPMATATTGYFIITVNISNTATDNNTIKVNGATNPVVLGFTTAPNYTNTQTDVAGTQTIQASSVTVSTIPVPSATITPGTTTQLVYTAQVNVTNQAATVNSIQVTLSGTYDIDDLSNVGIWFNASAPTLSGATNLSNQSGAFAAPHTYTFNLSSPLAQGSTGYYMVTINTTATATIGNTIHVNGATNPLVFGFTTSPNYTNSQTDVAGTIVLPVTLVSFGAKEQAGKVQVQWVTTFEANSRYFEVEHSTDGINFTSLGRINSKGNSNNNQLYAFTQPLPASGNNFYRLKQVDANNKITYSNVVMVLIKYASDMVGLVYPNPVIRQAKFIMVAKEDSRLMLKISDQLGRTVLYNSRQVIKGTNNFQLDVSALSAGSYQLQVVHPLKGIISTQKIIVQH